MQESITCGGGYLTTKLQCVWNLYVILFCRVGIAVPTIEVRYENVCIDADCYVGNRALPTLWNNTQNFFEVMYTTCARRSRNYCYFSSAKTYVDVEYVKKLELLLCQFCKNLCWRRTSGAQLAGIQQSFWIQTSFLMQRIQALAELVDWRMLKNPPGSSSKHVNPSCARAWIFA